MSGVSIKYGDYAPKAKENFTPTVTEKADFVNLTQLQQYNLDVANYANPCEYGSVLLDSSTVPFPKNPEAENMGYWSNSITKEDKTFNTPIVLTLTSTGQYSSQGFTFTFDTNNSIFCNNLNIKWYQNNTLLTDNDGNDLDIDFTPNSAFYFCEQQVDNFDKVVITFNSLNMPYNRLKIRSIDFGYGIIFTGGELSSVKIIQEINTLSSEIPVNIVDFTLKAKNDFKYSFQKKQPLSVYFNDNLLQTCFVDTSTRQGKREWKVTTNDYTGLLDTTIFMGDIYTNKNAVELLTSIFTQTNIPFEIDDIFTGITISGHIPICTCREAIKQICFAMVKKVVVDNKDIIYSAVVDTSYSNKIKIISLSDTITSTIPLNRILQGQKFTDNSTVTSVEVTSHKFMKNATDATELYKASESGTGTNILVKFSSPMYNLSITNGTIDDTKTSANYAFITANTGCILTGYGYKDVQTVKSQKNPVVLASEPENIVKFNNFYLVSVDNIDNILKKCYNESIKVNSMSLKIIEGKSEDSDSNWTYDTPIILGNNYTAETEYLGDLSGRIISQRYNCNGGILIKECEVI